MEVNNRAEAWLPEDAIVKIELFLKFRSSKYRNVCEFGCGSSTGWLSNMCEYLVSIEHEPAYYELIRDKKPTNTYILHERPYNECISTFEDETFDLILVDGRDRVKCIESAIPKLKRGGWLVLDNSEREEYQIGIDLMRDWKRKDHFQPEPDKYGFTYPDWKCSIFVKP